MRFYVNNNPEISFIPPDLPAFVLSLTDWDDFGTKSLFRLSYYNIDQRQKLIGTIKILKKGTSTTISIVNRKMTSVLPSSFDCLDEDYISLGQDLGFYEQLLSFCGRDMAIVVLEALNEISWRPPLATSFEPTPTFRNSLLRNNAAINARRFGQAVINGENVVEDFSFFYTTEIPGADEPTETHINFDEKDLVPGRIVGIIGRNATGKTRYLANLAQDLVQLRQTSSQKKEEKEEKFGGQRPIFNRVIAVSYSAFDGFTRPKSQHASYVYCGIRDENGRLSKTHLETTYQENLGRIREHQRQSDWVELMQQILGDQSLDLRAHLEAELSSPDIADGFFSLLSSGQAILANFITSLIAWLEEGSLVLFDEPETHLHPNAVSNLFLVLHHALKRYGSFAIIATHSPVVIQEIPSKRVLLFERNGKVTTARQVPVETFGENVSELTRHVFETINVSPYYKKVIEKLSQRKNFDQVMALFDDKLSLNAQSFLATRYTDDEQ